jgi:geranylgeranyl reductase family protein
MKQNWDVVIAGAGPAGAAAAITLAAKGVEVLLLDKAQFPRDKVCGDGIVTASLEIMHQLGIAANGFYPIHGVKIISPKKYTWQLRVRSKEVNRDTCIVPRMIFDHLLLQKALACGCHFAQSSVTDVLFEHNRVCGIQTMINGELRVFRSKVVIGADGVNSVIARRLRSDRQQERHRLIAMRGYLEDFAIQPHQVEVYLFKEIIPGYFWIFPMGEDRVNVGVGMRLDRYKKSGQNLRQILQNFMALPEIKNRCASTATLQNLQSWPLNLASQKKVQRSYNGALLVGDAGAWIDPLTGGGICNALITGQIAAETIYCALIENNFSKEFLKRYEQESEKKLGSEIKRSYYLQTILANFPGIIDILVKWGAKGTFLMNLANRMYRDLAIGNSYEAH